MAILNPPAIPASTVAQANTTEEDVLVVITGGTMTNVSINGATVGTGAGTYLLPPGGSITMTYSVAPTWTWQTVVANPAIPASGTALANPTGEDVNVTVSGGTVTNITVTNQYGASATVASGTPATFSVPQGGSVTMTYSVAPTWIWTNPLDLLVQGPAAEDTAPINEEAELPDPAYTADGEAGLGEAVSN